jgi:hypothetical protein
MDGTDAMSIHNQVADLIAVGLSSRGAIESSSENPFVQHEHTTNQGTIACASF